MNEPHQSASASNEPWNQFTLNVSYPWFAFLYAAAKPQLVTPRGSQPLVWGANTQPVDGLSEGFSVHVAYFGLNVGKADHAGRPTPGTVLHYRAPYVIWARGALGETAKSRGGGWLATLLLACVVGPIAVSVWAASLMGDSLSGSRQVDTGSSSTAAPDASEQRPPLSDTPPDGASDNYGLVTGDSNASELVVIYEDFLCPLCGQLVKTGADELEAAVEEGAIQVEYRPVALLERVSDYSLRSANAFAVVLDASGPEVAVEFHNRLFAEQPSEVGPFPDDDALVAMAVESGASEEDVRGGIEGMAFEGWVIAANQAAARDGIAALPSVLVDGEMVKAQTVDELVAALAGASS